MVHPLLLDYIFFSRLLPLITLLYYTRTRITLLYYTRTRVRTWNKG